MSPTPKKFFLLLNCVPPVQTFSFMGVSSQGKNIPLWFSFLARQRLPFLCALWNCVPHSTPIYLTQTPIVNAELSCAYMQMCNHMFFLIIYFPLFNQATDFFLIQLPLDRMVAGQGVNLKAFSCSRFWTIQFFPGIVQTKLSLRIFWHCRSNWVNCGEGVLASDVQQNIKVGQITYRQN